MSRSVLVAMLTSLPLAAATTARDVALPPTNPWTATGPYPVSHQDPAQTDVTVVARYG